MAAGSSTLADPDAGTCLPNTVAPLIVQGTYICASAILIEADPVLPRRRYQPGNAHLGQHHG